ncbi:hypothetical protein L195_g017743, partial [Trifolium pratense]
KKKKIETLYVSPLSTLVTLHSRFNFNTGRATPSTFSPFVAPFNPIFRPPSSLHRKTTPLSYSLRSFFSTFSTQLFSPLPTVSVVSHPSSSPESFSGHFLAVKEEKGTLFYTSPVIQFFRLLFYTSVLPGFGPPPPCLHIAAAHLRRLSSSSLFGELHFPSSLSIS